MDLTAVHAIARSLGVVALSLVAGTVGVRMLRLASRTRQLPELAIGLHIVVLLAGYLTEFAGIQLGDTFAGHVVRGIGNLCYAVAIQVYLLFTWRVFRRRSRWALAVVTVGTAMLVTGWIGDVLATTVDLRATRFALPWFWLAFLPRLVAMGWGAAEALRYHHRLALQLRIGLGEGVVANQFLLWGLAAAAELAIYAIVGVTILAGQPESFLTGTAALWISAFGVAAAAAMWLTFLPPEPVRRWMSSGV
ncbi:MAG: hypothetical protein ACE5FL_05415 [Myxococcota bacterium]